MTLEERQALMRSKQISDAADSASAADSAVLSRSARRERKRKLVTIVIILAACILGVAVIIEAVSSGQGKREALQRQHNRAETKPPETGHPAE